MSTDTNTDPLIEERFRDELFCGDLTKVFFSRLSCTVCDETLNSSICEGKFYEHPILKVLLCETHHRLNTAQMNINSGISRCTWCGLLSETNGGIVCIQCDRIFCKKCISLNFGPRAYEEARLRCDISVWQCFLCARKENFLFLRAICSAAKNCLQEEPITTEPSAEISNSNDDIDLKCVICLRNETSIGPEVRLQADYRLIELVCFHKFHKQCFEDWIKVNKSCPICRSRDVSRLIRVQS